MSNAEKFVELLNGSHSTFHAVSLMEKVLVDAGFIKLKENSTWQLENNRYYYMIKNGSSLIAFKIPEIANVKSVNIVASHSDSPVLKIKPIADMKDGHYNKLDVEVYGGPLLSTWADRPLSIAGRVTVKENGSVVSKLVDFNEDCAIIPNVAIHQNREANNGFKWNPQVDLLPMMGGEPKEDYFNERLAKLMNVEKENILGHDLYLYNRDLARVWGENKEFVSGPKIDNLGNAFASLEAFINSYSNNSLNVLSICDNEEVGSRTKQGMASSLLLDVIERVFAAFYYVPSDVKAILANSFMVSADNAHAVHPNHPEMYDSVNQTYMNKGVVIKTSASFSYVSDAVSVGVTKLLCDNAEVPYQLFANRSDSRGGGTLASIASSFLPINMVDVGCAQLAMHSSFETCGAKDLDYMIGFMSEFYNSTTICEDNKINIIK